MYKEAKYAIYVAEIRASLADRADALDIDTELVRLGFRGGWKAQDLAEAVSLLDKADKAATEWESFIVPIRHLATENAIALLSIRFQEEMRRKGIYWHNIVRDECTARFECCAHIWEERGYGHLREALANTADAGMPILDPSKLN